MLVRRGPDRYALKPLEVQAESESFYENWRPRQGGQRVYGSEDIRALSLIRHCRDLDFSIDETRDILASVQRRLPCSDTKARAEQRLRSIRTEIAELRAREAAMAKLVSGCETTCCGSPAPDCVILQPATSTGDHDISSCSPVQPV